MSPTMYSRSPSPWDQPIDLSKPKRRESSPVSVQRTPPQTGIIRPEPLTMTPPLTPVTGSMPQSFMPPTLPLPPSPVFLAHTMTSPMATMASGLPGSVSPQAGSPFVAVNSFRHSPTMLTPPSHISPPPAPARVSPPTVPMMPYPTGAVIPQTVSEVIFSSGSINMPVDTEVLLTSKKSQGI